MQEPLVLPKSDVFFLAATTPACHRSACGLAQILRDAGAVTNARAGPITRAVHVGCPCAITACVTAVLVPKQEIALVRADCASG
jgi:hypothetical protein